MNRFGEILKKIRQERNMSQEELAQLLGTTKQVISRYENNQRSPKVSVVIKYAETLGVSISTLTGDEQAETVAPLAESTTGLHRIPILGDTAAGIPILASATFDEYIDIQTDGRKVDAALRVKGDSMTPLYCSGDLVFIRYQDDVEDGQIAAICLDDEVTLKRIYHIPGGVQLVSENSAYKPMYYTPNEVNNAHLVGLAVGVLHWDN